jgi:hypothetical protein
LASSPKTKAGQPADGPAESRPAAGGGTEGAEPGEGGQSSQNEGPKGPDKEGRSSGDQEVDLEGLYSVEGKGKVKAPAEAPELPRRRIVVAFYCTSLHTIEPVHRDSCPELVREQISCCPNEAGCASGLVQGPLVPAGRLWPVGAREPSVHLGLPLLTREEKVRTVIGVGNLGPPLLMLSGGVTSLDGNRGCLLSVGSNLGSLISTATLTLPTFAFGLPVGFPHVFLHVLGSAGSLVTGPDNDDNGGSGVKSGRCSFGARTLDSVSSCTFLVKGLLSLLGCSGFPSGKLLPVLFKGLVHDTGVEGFSVLSAARSQVLLGKLLGHVRPGGGL